MASDRFRVHLLTAEGLDKAKKISTIFENAERELKEILPDGRDTSMTWTHLEDAAFRAKRAIARDPGNAQPQADD